MKLAVEWYGPSTLLQKQFREERAVLRYYCRNCYWFGGRCRRSRTRRPLRSDDVARHDHFDTAIQLAACRRAVVAHRVGFAQSDRRNVVGSDAGRNQITAYGICALL